MTNVLTPWGCLDDNNKDKSYEKTNPKTQKTCPSPLQCCNIPISQLSQPYVKGVILAISTSEEEYLVGLEARKHNLHGRIVWPKGLAPLMVVDLKDKLIPLQKNLSR
ncbi:unnamed protein product [Lathyrus oleraceus]